MIYAVFAGMFPAVAVVIIMQGVLVGEKRDGTAAWVMSKPISRPAFILSKVLANSLGVLATMVVSSWHCCLRPLLYSHAGSAGSIAVYRITMCFLS